MISYLKKLLPYTFKRTVKEKLGVPSLHWSLQNLKLKNFNPAMVIDVGAYEGAWTKDLLEVFPLANVLMIEAQQNKAIVLEKIKLQYPTVNYAIALLSASDGLQKYFIESETASNVSAGPVADCAGKYLTTRSLDILITEMGVAQPNLLKLDVQGHEMEVLKGAANALAAAEVCLLEVTLLDMGNDTPLLLNVMQFMHEKGFQAYDISHFIRRPFDKALYQLDMFFVKINSALISDKRWD